MRTRALLISAGLLAGLLPFASAATATGAGDATAGVATDAAVYPVTGGDAAQVKISLTTSGDAPTKAPVTVAYRTDGGTAAPGTDYRPVSGTVTFPAGSSPGASRTVTVPTEASDHARTARTIALELDVTGATAPRQTPRVVVDAQHMPYLDASLPIRDRVSDLLGRMSLADKVGQMTQAERAAIKNPADITTYKLGSLLSGGGSVPSSNTPQGWADMINGYQDRALATPLQIPMIYGVDAVHGHNNLVNATITPHNIGIGATRDPAIAEQTGEVTAAETRATGVPWAFAPCLCVSRDERWGRSYESFGEDPALVVSMETLIQGLQGPADGSQLAQNDKVLATAKHYVGDGGTIYGTSTNGTYTIDQGITKVTRKQLQDIHLPPFEEAVRRGVGSVMPSYSSMQITDEDNKPLKMHADGDLINGTLKGDMGFKGFVISDYAGIDQISPDYPTDVRTSVNAGIDMVMVPNKYTDFVKALTDQVNAGNITQARIDDAVSRILTQKFQLGLFEHPYADTSGAADIGSTAHREVARKAAAESQVLLKNDGGVLPLKKDQKVYVAGSNADDIGNQTGGWTVTWQGSSGNITKGTTILAGMRQAAPNAQIDYSKDASASTSGYDVGVVVVGETPYAEGMGDVGNGNDLALTAADKAAVDRVCGAMPCAVLVVSGRPQLIGDQLDEMDALVASWLPGTEGEGVADVLYGSRPFTGQLPVTWPKSEAQLPINVGDQTYDPQFPFGWGLTTTGASLRGGEHTLKALRDAARAADRGHATKAGRTAVAQARQLVQQTVGDQLTAAVAKPFAEADHALLTGHYETAVAKLTTAYEAVGR
ncbi:glycoside hydrolase family 3 N-terminal domain-containing protein [Streptomyces odontomachi]|uniref:glycoside hydrolase family 3 N-terminal domain-containing protein n=1 Tax=Streptomyces odontomachi TaxID=2944940 RepID=UPI00210C697A|nr:glycoside hydrolase family 3 N-terminal domain-containing protein [Streptomyces sp. ODS25]